MEILLFWMLFGFVGLAIGQKKGINLALAFIAGVLLGPLVLLMLVVKTDTRKCPSCAEFVNKDAKICKHCKTPLPA